MEQSPAALRIHTNRRQEFDSYFPLEEYNEEARVYDTDFASLPFPAPLSTLRSNFRGDNFDCDSFLLQHQKHGQLDDLLQELRGLSGLLDSELIKGVEEDYEAFIGLGRMDPRKVDDLKRGVLNVLDQLSRIEREVQEKVDDVDATLKARRTLRRKKKQVRATLKVSMAIDEVAFLLEQEKDQEGVLEAMEQLGALTRKVPVPEYDKPRLQELISDVSNALTQSIKNARLEEKLDHAILLHRFYACRPDLEATEPLI